MAIRFSTQAANADKLNDDGKTTTPLAPPKAAGEQEAERADEAKPGKGINTAGFLKEKDKDAGKP